MRKKITSIKGKTVEAVYSTGSYIIIRMSRGIQLQVHVDSIFDKDGNRYEDDAPDFAKAKKA